ncbi:MAG: hypothetical protein IE916_02175, partial [Epsilonproteobacteria bacterium]|nr:hypothetical protein [Campylobacterota bacterium]
YKVEDFISPLSSRIENKNIPSSLLEALVEVERFISDLSYEISGQQRILKDFTEKVEPLILEGMFNDVDFRSESLRSLRESYQHKKDNVVSDFLSLWRDIPKYSYYKETRTILPGHINSLLAAKENLGEAWNSEEIVDKCMYLEGGCSRGMLFCHKNQMKKNVGAVEDAMNTLYDEFRPMLEKQGVIEKWEAAVPSFQEHISKFSDYTPTTYVLNEFSGGNVNKALRRCIENRGIDQKPTDETPSVKVSI